MASVYSVGTLLQQIERLLNEDRSLTLDILFKRMRENGHLGKELEITLRKACELYCLIKITKYLDN